MIPQKEEVTINSTLRSQDVQMSIEQSALAHIMSVLTGLYADPEMAAIREYATNAWDAHLAAGQDKPIEVSTPTSLRPMLTIKDYGLGLNKKDIEEIYSRYGASTKRDNNDTVGMLGLGCKSALAYVDQFTMTAIKNGILTRVIVSRDDQGVGQMSILEESETNEANGVEINIPAPRDNTIAAKAKYFFSFWQPGTVLLDGHEVKKVEGYQLNKRMRIVDNNDLKGRFYGGHIVVMGNVPYPVANLNIPIPYNKTLIVDVAIGDVLFAPSREQLQDCQHTQKTLDAIGAEYKRERERVCAREMKKAKSAGQALQVVHRMHNEFQFPISSEKLQWRGHSMTATYELADDEIIWNAPIIPNHRRTNRVSAPFKISDSTISTNDIIDTCWVINFDNKNCTAQQRKKVLAYAVQENKVTDDIKRIFFISDARIPLSPWTDDALIIDWQDVRLWRQPREKNKQGQRLEGKYELYDPARQLKNIDAAEIDATCPIIYSEDSEQFTMARRQELSEMLDDFYFVKLNRNRVSKFKKLFPKAQSLTEFRRQAAEKWWNDLNEKEKEAIAGWRSEALRQSVRIFNVIDLDSSRVHDPELRALIDNYPIYREVYREKNWPLHQSFIDHDVFAPYVEADTVLDRYPLLIGTGRYSWNDAKEHYIIYVNAVYAERKTLPKNSSL